MSDIYSQNPFVPPPNVGPQQTTLQAPAQQQGQPDLSGQWRNWMSDPANRAALIQFGVQLMQPVALGQNAAGHIGQAIGSAGEAQGRVATEEAARRKESLQAEEAASKQDLRSAQALRAEAGATAASARNDSSAARLELAREKLNSAQEGSRLTNLIRAQNLYRQEIAGIRKTNTDNAIISPTTPKLPEPTFEEWMAKNPMLSGALKTEGPFPSAAPTSETQPSQGKFFLVDPKVLDKYPDAKQAPDGKWYIKR